MDLKDQVAIHEAMEQQTISIAKAGIRATLNARASILAAANPIGGRYNPRKNLRQNLGISPAIMSRFDLFFVIQDECDPDMDRNIAEHIISVHQKKQVQRRFDLYTPEEINLYIKYARTIKPQLSEEAQTLLVKSYGKLRQNDKVGSNSYRITVRQLESLVRISEGLARLYSEDTVETYHVEEAVRLLRTSITKVDKDPVNLDDAQKDDEQIVLEKRKRIKNQEQQTNLLISTLQTKKVEIEAALHKATRALQDTQAQLDGIQQELNQLHSQLENSSGVAVYGSEEHEKIYSLEQEREECENRLSVYREQVSQLTRDRDNQAKKVQDILDDYGEGSTITTRQEESSERPRKKRKIHMDLSDYREMSLKILRYIRSRESESEVTKQQVIDWYISQMTITQDEASNWISQVKKVVHRLIHKDNFILVCSDQEQNKNDMSTVLIVNPNVDLVNF